MSDSLFHFVFPFLAIMATGLRIKHRIVVAVALASLAVLLDIDHFLGFVPRGTFHNIFITLLLPALLFLIAFKFEKKGDFWKTVTLMSALVLFSHPMVDMFVGDAGVRIFYPFSDKSYLFNFISVPVTLPNGFIANVISSEGIGLSIFVLFIFGIIFVEDFVNILTKYKSTERALKKTMKIEEKRIKKGL